MAKRRTNWVDWNGQRVNYLLVLGEAGVNKDGLILWLARCTYDGCDNTITVTSQMLHRGQESCGCKASADTRRRALDKYRGSGQKGGTHELEF
jgi:hypothetical protein